MRLQRIWFLSSLLFGSDQRAHTFLLGFLRDCFEVLDELLGHFVLDLGLEAVFPEGLEELRFELSFVH